MVPSYSQTEAEKVTNLLQQVSNEALNIKVHNILFPDGESDCMEEISDDQSVNSILNTSGYSA